MSELCIVVRYQRNGKLYIFESIMTKGVMFMSVYTVDEVEITSRLDIHKSVYMKCWLD